MIEILHRYTKAVLKTVDSNSLSGADLRSANLSGADLRSADLRSANLRSADLRSADLSGANLSGANLRGADLSDADLIGANLSGANLSDADLSGANLSDADLLRFKSDLWRILLYSKNEIAGLKQAMNEGRIKGTAYEGECCCLKGTIANVRHCGVSDLGVGKNVSEPCEQWFLQFKVGQTPENYQPMKLTMDWIEEFEMLNSK